MEIRDYIWDLGGTLLDNYETSTAAFVATLSYYGLPASHDAVYEALKVSTQHAVQLFAPSQTNFLRMYKANEVKELEHPILFEGARELLEELTRAGARHFMVSHRDNHVLEILDKTGIAAYFTEVVTADNGFARKPAPDSIYYLRDKYQIERGLVIGDREIDVQAGQAAGLATYLFDDIPHLRAFLQEIEGQT